MGRPLQFVDELKRIFEITVRCIQGRFLLRTIPERNRRMLGVIARSLEVCGGHVELYLAGGTSNHIHFIVGVTDGDWKARWKSHVLTNLSKEIGDLYDWPGLMFERRARDIPILDDDALVLGDVSGYARQTPTSDRARPQRPRRPQRANGPTGPRTHRRPGRRARNR